MKNRTKLAIAIVLVLMMIPTMGVVHIKDSLHSSSYCATCHEDPYYSDWENPDAEYSLAHAHAKQGISCQTCHNRSLGDGITETVNFVIGNYYHPLPETELSMEVCFNCHESYESIITLTDPDITGEERNPHAGHWGELECSECHNMHRDSFDYCAECHNPVTDSPGWVTSRE
ncbi:MAG: cytochrome c3 family protein [Anaerolineales bacterium]